MNGFLFWHKLILQKKNSQEKWTNKNINMRFFKEKKATNGESGKHTITKK